MGKLGNFNCERIIDDKGYRCNKITGGTYCEECGEIVYQEYWFGKDWKNLNTLKNMKGGNQNAHQSN